MQICIVIFSKFAALATQISISANSHFQPRLEPIYDGTETGRNRPVSHDLFESDIVLTVDQLKGFVFTFFYSH